MQGPVTSALNYDTAAAPRSAVAQVVAAQSRAEPVPLPLVASDDRLMADLGPILARNCLRVECLTEADAVERFIAAEEPPALLFDGTNGRDEVLCDDFAGHLLTHHPRLRLVGLLRPGEPLSMACQELLRLGWIHDLHSLPLDEQRFLHCIGHVQGLAALERSLGGVARAEKPGLGRIVGASRAMQEIYEMIWRIARVDTPVLITGESGTGKELVARAIHERSARGGGPFAAVNCAALPASLIASELFGHEAGAFTGALRAKRGLVEEAHRGTLFLDEIGDMPLELQPHILRFVQDGTFKRVGGTATLRVDHRLIAATNADLERAIQEGAFREDLYYRLNVLHIHMPPLRERADDIERLAEYYLHKFSRQYDRPRLRFSSRAVMAMLNHSWPGNVRELVSAVSRAVILCRGVVIGPEDLGLGAAGKAPARPAASLFAAREEFDRGYILASLERNRCNVRRAAQELGISRVALYRLMKRYGIEKLNREKRRED